MAPTEEPCAKCAGLIRLCSGLDYFPADAAVRTMLVEKLHRVAHSHQDARAMIDRWLERNTTAPKVADLFSLAADTRSVHTLPDGCDKCFGEPWVADDSGARRCSCRRGQAYRKMEQHRVPEPLEATARFNDQ